MLIKASDYFTDAAEKIGVILGFNPFIVGVTIVAIGTSIPELVSSIFAVLKDSSEIVIANVVGSNIANIFLILGVAAVISGKHLAVEYDLAEVDLPLFVGSAFLLALTVRNGELYPGEAILLLLGFVVYTLYAVNSAKENEPEEDSELSEESKENPLKQTMILVVSAVFIFLGANFSIDSLVKLSEILNIGKEVIAVIALALGTSLPELFVSISAAKKGNAELAIGNVVGSNIFNAFVVMGVPGLINHLEIPETVLTDGVPVMLAGTILFFFTTQFKKVTRWEGWLFLIFYLWFVGETVKIF
ncbi:MAG: calcium/sodium antiporter [Gomphosphaeria aponina SAG 52.96 = DSM 107014]|uniref:Calcium/sodium antiporter n=1 Tax=Gomphosphaeria aponina SAG 52.96 = DSM 107014 TaxID=1521640 RepID=A0A941GV48_9CHRO|nr:calcium/sodium antiporter [Gomphosphaeria aponina SAG 52.96 = DSM 107014]